MPPNSLMPKILLEDQIALLKDAFNLTATSYGLQTLSLVVVSNNVA